MPNQKKKVELVFDALGDRTRRAIVERLSRGPVSVSQLAAPLAITLTAVVQHLQILEQSGLVQTEKIGRVRNCRLEPAGFPILEQWARYHRSLSRLATASADGYYEACLPSMLRPATRIERGGEVLPLRHT